MWHGPMMGGPVMMGGMALPPPRGPPPPAPPPDWKEAKTPDGKTYWYIPGTQTVSWNAHNPAH